MCYYIYGALFGQVDENSYENIKNKYRDIHFTLGTKHDMKMCVQDVDCTFRITDGCCDCGTDLGKGNAESEEIKPYCDFFEDIKRVDGIKHIYLCKTWAGKRNKSELKLKLNEINVCETLANIKENCLYTFEV